jgi:uncharacterized membrane protein YfcA
MELPPALAVAMSLIVVGLSAGLGALLSARRGLISVRVGGAFGAASAVGAVAGARLTPLVPPQVLMRLFAVLMLVVGATMLLWRAEHAAVGVEGQPNLAGILAAGLGVGVLTGFLGVGGGFLILPALLWIGRLPMARAVGTSLAVIAVSSSAGVAGHLVQLVPHWPLATGFTVLAGAGVLLGSLAAPRIPAGRLRVSFAGLVVAVGLTILLNDLGAAWLPW